MTQQALSTEAARPAVGPVLRPALLQASAISLVIVGVAAGLGLAGLFAFCRAS